ncbi:NSFL1 cofactor p47-like isoform X3 [Macrobrachium nipponense]
MIGQESDSSEDESGQAFYAGGSTHSGQQVLGPPKKKSDMVAKLFKSAKEHGAEVVEGSKDGKKSKKFNYSGTGYRLGETNDDTQGIGRGREEHDVANLESVILTKAIIPAAGKEEEEPRDVLLKMWRTGFTVDNGPLRSYEDPSNAEFLNSIRRGEIPLELIREARGGEVYINMADHRHEDYVAPKTSLRPFTGSGHSLGSPAPNVVGQVSHLSGAVGGASKTSAVSAASLDPKAAEKKAQDDLKIDSQQPTTNIQVRLPDGSRLIIKLNHTHAVSDIRQYISTARPSYETTEFALMTTFPHAEVTELSQTVAEAKLLNAALVVKPK